MESHKRHKWETIWESTESIEGNVNGLRQTDIRIEFEGQKFPFMGSI